LEATIALLRGERISARPRLVRLGDVLPNEERQSTIEVVNHSDIPIRIVGGTSDCSCVLTDDLPTTIPARDGRSLRVRVRFGRLPGIFTRKVTLYTEGEHIGIIAFYVSGEIIERSSNP